MGLFYGGSFEGPVASHSEQETVMFPECKLFQDETRFSFFFFFNFQ